MRGAMVVRADPAATAHNILAHEQLYRLGGGADLLTLACDIALAALFYVLLKPCSPTTALVASYFRLAYAAIMGVVSVTHFAPLVFLQSAGLGGFTNAQLESLAFGFAGAAALTLTYGFLQNAGLPEVSWIWVWPVMAVCWIIGSLIARRRYR